MGEKLSIEEYLLSQMSVKIIDLCGHLMGIFHQGTSACTQCNTRS